MANTWDDFKIPEFEAPELEYPELEDYAKEREEERAKALGYRLRPITQAMQTATTQAWDQPNIARQNLALREIQTGFGTSLSTAAGEATEEGREYAQSLYETDVGKEKYQYGYDYQTALLDWKRKIMEAQTKYKKDLYLWDEDEDEDSYLSYRGQ